MDDRRYERLVVCADLMGFTVALGLLASSFTQSELPPRTRASTFRGQEPPSLAQYAKWMKYRRDDDLPFGAWSGNYNGGQPYFTRNLPEDMKPWSTWYRNYLQDGQQILSEAEILRAREFVARYVYHDDRADYQAGESGAVVVARLRAVCRDALRHAGITRPSSELSQLLGFEACAQFVLRRANYDLEALRTKKTVSYGGQSSITTYLSRRPIPVVCEEASELLRLLVREWVRQSAKAGDSMPMEANVVSYYVAWGGPTPAHAWTGLAMKCRDGRLMKIFFDPTPASNNVSRDFTWRIGDVHSGTLSRVGVELFLADYRPEFVRLLYQDIVGLRKPDQIKKLKADLRGMGVHFTSRNLRSEENFGTGIPIEYPTQGETYKTWSNPTLGEWKRERARLSPDIQRLQACFVRMGRF
ncbi:MAG: hypothetical protein EON58_13680 [Alphaproteobacteria bacterium]|nr:MAG: hypothetical protein EON58_13680 [Alphaproteobacteria bacterium]